MNELRAMHRTQRLTPIIYNCELNYSVTYREPARSPICYNYRKYAGCGPPTSTPPALRQILQQDRIAPDLYTAGRDKNTKD